MHQLMYRLILIGGASGCQGLLVGRVLAGLRGKWTKCENFEWERRCAHPTLGLKIFVTSVRMDGYVTDSIQDVVNEDADLEQPSVEPIARISVSLPRSLYRQFRLHALDQDTTLSALMARLIRQEINRQI
jgi:hypothetical protein